MKEMILDALKKYREQQILADGAKYAAKDELRGYIKTIVPVADGLIFVNGAGEEIIKIPTVIKNPNLNGGD